MVYNSETKLVEESIDIKFGEKASDSKMSELDGKFSEFHIYEDP